MEKASRKYEIKDLHFHDLRHEAISRYLERIANTRCARIWT